MTFRQKIQSFLRFKTKDNSIDLSKSKIVTYRNASNNLITIDLDLETITDRDIEMMVKESYHVKELDIDSVPYRPIYFASHTQMSHTQIGEASESSEEEDEKMHPLFDEISALLKSLYGRTLLTKKIVEQGAGVDLVPTNDVNVYLLKLYDDFLDIAYVIEVNLNLVTRDCKVIDIFIGDDGTQPLNCTLEEESPKVVSELKKCLDLLDEKIAELVTKTKKIDHENSVIEMASSSVHNVGKGLVNQDSVGIFLINSVADDQRNFLVRAKELTDEILTDTRKNLSSHSLQNNGSTFCGVAIKKGKTTLDTQISIKHLGDSRPFLVLRNQQGKEVLISLTEDADPDVKRFNDKVIEEGGSVFGNRVGTLNMASSFGDTKITGVTQTPEIYEYNLDELLKNFPELSNYQPVKIITVSDGITKLEGLDDKNYYPTPYYTVKCSGQYGDTSAKEFVKHEKANAENYSYSAQTLLSHAINTFSVFYTTAFIDDNAAAEIDLEKMQEGQEMLAIIADGHGKGGHEISHALKTSAVKNKNLVQLPNHATQEMIAKLKEDKEAELDQSAAAATASSSSITSMNYSSPESRRRIKHLDLRSRRHSRNIAPVDQNDVAAAQQHLKLGTSPSSAGAFSVRGPELDKERDNFI